MSTTTTTAGPLAGTFRLDGAQGAVGAGRRPGIARALETAARRAHGPRGTRRAGRILARELAGYFARRAWGGAW